MLSMVVHLDLLVLGIIMSTCEGTSKPDSATTSPPCFRCCDPNGEDGPGVTALPVADKAFQPVPEIEISIVKGEKGHKGDRGSHGKRGFSGPDGIIGPIGPPGRKGSNGLSGEDCKVRYSAFSVARRTEVHSNDYFTPLVFDTEFVNTDGHFNVFMGRFFCYIPGIYYFNVNVHTWNSKETYLHIMHNDEATVVLYAQPGERSIMQSQSVMLELKAQDEVWVRLFKRSRENALYSDDVDTYITFNGFLVKPSSV
uniref:complement C1q tumor necrosis factor-related protein 1 n=1 Tax=Myxine glutinosa TaxID=7769 RepID=UPI00358E50A8